MGLTPVDILVGTLQVLILWGAYMATLEVLIWSIDRCLNLYSRIRGTTHRSNVNAPRGTSR